MAFNNQGSQYDISAVTGYNPLILSSYMQLLGVIRGSPIDPADRVPMITTYNFSLLKLLNVRYLVSYKLLPDAQLDLVYQDYPYVYKLDQPENNAFMVYHAEYFNSAEQIAARMSESSFDPARSVLLEQEIRDSTAGSGQRGVTPDWWVTVHGSGYNKIDFDVYTSASGWLVVSEIYYPGWKVYIDEQEKPIQKADLALRAIELTPGRHTVGFVYRPDSLRYGLVMSFAGILLFFVCVILLVLKQRSKTAEILA
jgi:hypothetical protein